VDHTVVWVNDGDEKESPTEQRENRGPNVAPPALAEPDAAGERLDEEENADEEEAGAEEPVVFPGERDGAVQFVERRGGVADVDGGRQRYFGDHS
jgi:hypothetical protein